MEGGPNVQGPELTGGREATWVVYPDKGGVTPEAYSWAPGQGAVRRAEALPGDASECTPPTAHQELVSGCSHQGDWWAWGERAKPGPDVLDDPEYLYVAGPGTRQRVAHLGFAAQPPILIDVYLLWESEAGLEATSLDHLGRNTLISRNGYFVGSTDGRTAAVVIEGRTGTTARLFSTS